MTLKRLLSLIFSSLKPTGLTKCSAFSMLGDLPPILSAPGPLWMTVFCCSLILSSLLRKFLRGQRVMVSNLSPSGLLQGVWLRSRSLIRAGLLGLEKEMTSDTAQHFLEAGRERRPTECTASFSSFCSTIIKESKYRHLILGKLNLELWVK